MSLLDVVTQFGEQLLHLTWGFGIVSLVWLSLGYRRNDQWWIIPTAALAAAVIVLPRELVDQWPVERAWDTALDLFGFAVGGGLAGLVVKEAGR